MNHLTVPAPHRRRRRGTPPALVLTGLLLGLLSLFSLLGLLSGCGMTDNDPGKSSDSSSGTSESGDGSSKIPFAGTSSTDDGTAAVKAVSSQIYDFLGVPGTASQPGPGVRACEGSDPQTHFQVYHPWNFRPKTGADNDVAMENLEQKLSTGGWVVKDSYRDNSANRNLNIIADHDAKKMSVWAVAYSRRATPSIGIEVTSGCYRAPEGETVEHY